jgi:hypothetical protein
LNQNVSYLGTTHSFVVGLSHSLVIIWGGYVYHLLSYSIISLMLFGVFLLQVSFLNH